MAFTRTDPAVNPVSLIEAKRHLAVDHDDDNDYIERLVKGARKKLEDYTNRVFATSTVTATYEDFPRQPCDYTDGIAAIRLPLWPVASVTSVKYYNASGTLTTLTVTTDYLTYLARTPALIYPAPTAVWPQVQFQRMGRVQVIFVAGVDTAIDLGRVAMLQMVGYWYGRKGDDNANQAEEGIPPAAMSIMNDLRRPMYE